jgi:glycosyltransferase involved in cell wall biosynthesis
VRLAVDASNLARDRRGMGRFVRSVLRAALSEADIELELLSLRRGDDAAIAAGLPGVRVRACSAAKARGRYDAVWYPWNGVRFPAAAATLVTIYDAFAFDEPARGWIARRREQEPIRRAARTARQISTISQWSRERIVARLGVDRERIAVVPLAPDAFFFPGSGEGLPETLRGRRYALLVGAREARKNARLALEACAGALGPGETLVVVGELASADARLAKRLRLSLGNIAAGDETLRALYRDATVVLVPSFAEGFGLVGVEALACGAPVLAANSSALPEALEGLAPLLDPHDPGVWAREIRRVFDEPAYANALRARGVARFAYADRNAPARATLGLLRELAAKNPASSRAGT